MTSKTEICSACLLRVMGWNALTLSLCDCRSEHCSKAAAEYSNIRPAEDALHRTAQESTDAGKQQKSFAGDDEDVSNLLEG